MDVKTGTVLGLFFCVFFCWSHHVVCLFCFACLSIVRLKTIISEKFVIFTIQKVNTKEEKRSHGGVPPLGSKTPTGLEEVVLI